MLLVVVKCKDVVIGSYQAVSVFKDSALAKLRKKDQDSRSEFSPV